MSSSAAAATTATPTASRPVHPCVTSLTDRTRGAEFCVWARLRTAPAPAAANTTTQNLVTASASSLAVYSVVETETASTETNNTKLRLEHSFGPLAGTIVSLHTLSPPSNQSSNRNGNNPNGNTLPEEEEGKSCDALLVGFGGRHAQLAVVTLPQSSQQQQQPQPRTPPLHDDDNDTNEPAHEESSLLFLRADCLLDFATPSLRHDATHGSVSCLDDIDVQVAWCPQTHTVACILGGGVAVAIVSLQYHNLSGSGSWSADEPYLLPLAPLAAQFGSHHHHHHPHAAFPSSSTSTVTTTANSTAAAAAAADGTTATTASTGMATGWGDILHAVFLSGYPEPVLVLLHTAPGGPVTGGRRATTTTTSTTCYYCTALSVAPHHQRTALLWSTAVPSDAYAVSTTRAASTITPVVVVVTGVNSITFADPTTGRIAQCLAVNGWATANNTATTVATPNRPLKLALSLDGAQMAWMDARNAAVVLRHGAVYWLQNVVMVRDDDDENHQEEWTLWPTGQFVTGCGEIASLAAWTTHRTQSSPPPNPEEDENFEANATATTGLLFAGSRLGDSWLLGFEVMSAQEPSAALQRLFLDNNNNNNTAVVEPAGTDEEGWKPQVSGNEDHVNEDDDDDDEDIYRLEDEALYGPSLSSPRATAPDVVPWNNSSDEEEPQQQPTNRQSTLTPRTTSSSSRTHQHSSPHKRARILTSSSTPSVTAVRTLTPLDVVVNLGPLGPACEGPIAAPPAYLVQQQQERDVRTAMVSSGDDNNNNQAAAAAAASLFGSTAHVVPAGYGSSGGLALVTVPGRDDRMIVTEADCWNAQCVFALPIARVVLLGLLSDGIRVLRFVTHNRNEPELVQVNATDDSDDNDNHHGWCRSGAIPEGPFLDTQEIFESTLLSAAEYTMSSGSSSHGNHGIALVARSRATLEVALILLTTATQSNKNDKDDGGGNNSQVHIVAQHALHTEDYSGALQSVTPIVTNFKNNTQVVASFACVWSVGTASVVSISPDGSIATRWIPRTGSVTEDAMEVDDGNDKDQETWELEQFYADGSVVAVDIFQAPTAMFDDGLRSSNAQQEASTGYAMEIHSLPMRDGHAVQPSDPTPTPVIASANHQGDPTDWNKLTVVKLKSEMKKRNLSTVGKKADLVASLEAWDHSHAASATTTNSENLSDAPTTKSEVIHDTLESSAALGYGALEDQFDEEDRELYAMHGQEDGSGSPLRKYAASATQRNRCESRAEKHYLAVCRRNGDLEVYSMPDDGTEMVLCWRTKRSALGGAVLETSVDDGQEYRLPRSHKISVKEFRFFSCGPTGLSTVSNFCLAIETSAGDLFLYLLDRHNPEPRPSFRRKPLRTIARSSLEQGRHLAKLVRKGIAPKSEPSEVAHFFYNSLFLFRGISGQDGLFALGPRPQWFVCERGCPTVLAHRTRHAAPAGGKPKPVTGFSMGLGGEGDFLTLHERVGRVGSQRLTVFRGLANVFDTHGLLLGSGYCVEKIPLGVTVRRIVYIEDGNASTGDHPLYALLVSREIEVNQSGLNSDGLSQEERRQQKEDTERAKIARQVEADLGGFEVESEWVEEIEREDCFKINSNLGGAPPLHQSVYSLWIVNAADRWMVVDSFELGEHEHGLDLQAMYLTEFKDDPGNTSSATTAEDDGSKRYFIVVGTGTVNHNGEDVATKGRALLFGINRPKLSTPDISSPVAELTLAFEKNVFHGPVSTVSCLAAEGRNRLVIGAGSDVNIEQWGSNEKLTQVGFFRATMHISDIMHFRNFLLLSDAYDSLYFLVWRESDKSLTLLAKDYDPIPVYAAGIMSRGAALTFLCHDDRENLQFFQYAPGEAAARGGNKLVCRADFHLGCQTTAFRTHFCRPSLLIHSATPASTLAALKQQDSLFGRQDDDQRLGVHFGTSDGGLGSVVPLSEPVYWRLMALQSVMANALESDCALSQRAWRLYRRTPRRGGCRSNDRKKGVIDGDLVMKFGDLPITQQEDIASAIGSTVDLILDNLLEIQCGSMII